MGSAGLGHRADGRGSPTASAAAASFALSRTTIGRVLAAVDGDALDRAVGAYLAGRNTAETASGTRQVIAVDGKSLRGSARLPAGRRHLLSAVTHHRALPLAQAEVGAKTNETAQFRPLLESLGLDGVLITFDALHSVQANVTWLVETQNAHYIAMIKGNQPTAYRQLPPRPGATSPSSTPPPAPDTAAGSPAPSRPAASPTKSVGSPSFTAASPSASTDAANNQWAREPRDGLCRHQPRRPRDHTGRTRRGSPRPLDRRGPAPRARRDLRRGPLHPPHRHRTPRHGHLPQLAIGLLKTLGATNIAKTTRAIRDQPERALPLLGIINNPDTQGT